MAHFTYKAMAYFRICRKWRTLKCNCKTSKHVIHFLHLSKSKFISKAQEVYKCRELTLNTDIMN